MFAWPAGGFLGVDVFFVISGFLITGLLLREYDRTGHISFRRFYVSRIKRIVPSATVVIVVSIGLAFLLFTRQRAVSTSWDALWAFVFGANWNFAAAGTDYFQQGAAVSPLQHYWSLSVEEQFYFVWPWLLLGLLALFARFMTMTTAGARVIAGTAIAALSLASFLWALQESVTNPTIAYFSTLTRGWEIGVGALIAIAAPALPRLVPAARAVLAYAGLAGIIASCFVITPGTPWPAPWAALPVTCTALVLASGAREEAPGLWPLTNPLATFVGNISYSLYLWHFPVIIFSHSLYPDAGPWVYPGIALVGFALAAAQHYAIEVPLWRSPLWMKRASESWADWRYTYRDQMKNGFLAGFVTIGVAVAGIAFVPPPEAPYLPPASSSPLSSTSPGIQDTPAVAAEQRTVADALTATTWPATLTPPIDEVGSSSKVEAWVSDGCLALEKGAENDPSATVDRCVYGPHDATDRIALVGDSMAISWLPALQAAFPDAQIRVLTMQQCPFAAVTVVKLDESTFPECTAFHTLVDEKLSAWRPTLAVLSQADNSTERTRGSTSMSQGLETAIAALSAESNRTVVLPPPPNSRTITDCYTPTGSPRNCISAVPQRALSTAVDLKTAAERGGVEFIDTLPLICRSGQCPSVVGGMVVSADGAHLTQVFSASLGPAFAELLAAPPAV